MPEGGSLVAGISAKIGFKGRGEDGRGTALSGIVYDSNNYQVAAFKTLHNGIGSFELLPLAGESYTARVTFANSITKTYSLPAQH